LTPEKQAKITQEVADVLAAIWDSHGSGQWKDKNHGQ
jgi:isocitrate dehydrogenase (NADP) (EC 1.1.1.42)